MATKWKVGDVVQLKSGGEYMTVIDVNDEGYVTTTWHDKGKKKDATYPAGALTLVASHDNGPALT